MIRSDQPCPLSEGAKAIKVGDQPVEVVGQVAKDAVETNNHKPCLVHIVLAPIDRLHINDKNYKLRLRLYMC